LFGDYSKKLKKWAIFVFADYASMIGNDIYFAAFRLTQLNAFTTKLPSGGSAVVMNTSMLALTPILYSLFLDIYEVGTATRDSFECHLQTRLAQS
jgi:hypothetical protein